MIMDAVFVVLAALVALLLTRVVGGPLFKPATS